MAEAPNPAAAPAKPEEAKTAVPPVAAPATAEAKAAPAGEPVKGQTPEPVADKAAPVPDAPVPNLLEVAAAPPAKIEIAVPKDLQIDPKVLEAFKEKAQGVGLTQAQAQGQFDLYVSLQRQATNTMQEQAKAREGQRLEVLRKDPEFGGANFDSNVVAAQKALVRFGTPELNKEIAALGNNPALLKVLARVGKTISEDRTVSPPNAPSIAAQKTELDLIKERYPSMFKETPAE
jgi:hypothetical protein